MKSFDKLAKVEGSVSIKDGIAALEDGSSIDLNDLTLPRVLVTVSGGVAMIFVDSNSILTEIVDFDDLNGDDIPFFTVPASWADLAPHLKDLFSHQDAPNHNPTVLEVMSILSNVDGMVSINDGIAKLDDGVELSLVDTKLPRVLVTISGGVASVFSDDNALEVRLFDADDYEDSPETAQKVPASWADMLPVNTSIPFTEDVMVNKGKSLRL